jgi:hypothetical protein
MDNREEVPVVHARLATPGSSPIKTSDERWTIGVVLTLADGRQFPWQEQRRRRRDLKVLMSGLPGSPTVPTSAVISDGRLIDTRVTFRRPPGWVPPVKLGQMTFQGMGPAGGP